MARSRIFRLAFVACLACCQAAAAETVLLDFTSDRCPPCSAMAPIVRQLAAQRYHVREVNVSQDPASMARYNVTVTPTFVVLVDGQEWARLEGKTDYAQLVEMMHKATALAAARNGATVRGQSPANDAPIDMVADQGRPGATFAAGPAPGPAPGRVVSIQEPQAPTRPAAREAAAQPVSEQAAQLIAATVRLSIEDPDGRSTGTGAIIDARSGEALVLTCGHLFRASNGKGRIEISRFAVTPAGVQVVETSTGVLMHYDLNRDLALVRFSPSSTPAVAPVAPLGTTLEPGAPVTSVGCNHGDNATAWSTRITAINRYQGFPNIEAGGAPIEGRSGGGLFNAQGQLIGVCFAADPHDDEGLYASLSSIQAKLDELQLSMVYQTPSRGPAPNSDAGAVGRLAANSSPDSFAVRGQDPSATVAPDGVPDWPARPETAAPAPGVPAPAPSQMAAAPVPGLTPQEQAALQEIGERGADSEVICIIRPLTPGGRSDVIKLNNVSPAFVQALTGQAAQAPSESTPFGGATPTAAAAGPTVR